MIQIHNKYIRKYISKEQLSQYSIIDYLFNTDTYKVYTDKVSKVSKELSVFSSGAELVPHLTKNFGLSLKKAREFVNKNVTYNWKKGNYIDNKCDLIHIRRNSKIASKKLENTLNSIQK